MARLAQDDPPSERNAYDVKFGPDDSRAALVKVDDFGTKKVKKGPKSKDSTSSLHNSEYADSIKESELDAFLKKEFKDALIANK